LRRHIESNEQRDGRGVRQANQVYGPVLDSSGAVVDPGAGIRIFVYLTARSFDGYVFVRYVSPEIPSTGIRRLTRGMVRQREVLSTV